MLNINALRQAITELKSNPEQFEAVSEQGHCVVLAGPGSGKTKTLTTAIARTLFEDVIEPRGVACITYNNECVMELETRLSKFGIRSSRQCFVGTVHSFALNQIILPYARCVKGMVPDDFSVATNEQKKEVIEFTHKSLFSSSEDPHNKWRFAELKRRKDVDRSLPSWRGRNSELADFIESYESELRNRKLIDFDDMPLIAYRMVKEHSWIREALQARFPVLFVDEYQDLGYALHELVQLLCFESGIRLFVVGDSDQSIYDFTGADPELLESLSKRSDVKTICLRFNYRSGTNIVKASMGALGSERDYCCIDGAEEGNITYWPIDGDIVLQIQSVADMVIPKLLTDGFKNDQIAILYRAAWLGDKVAEVLKNKDIPFFRTDTNALVKRSSPLGRFIEACAEWICGGWKDANPSFEYLLKQALNIVYGRKPSEVEKQILSEQLIMFLQNSIDTIETTNQWLKRFQSVLIIPWIKISRNIHVEWDVCDGMILKTDPSKDLDMSLSVFSGRVEGCGRVILSTLHSAKGREFDAVIMIGLNDSDFPSWRDNQSVKALHEARRLFYVGVTRPRKELSLVFKKGHHSSWVGDLYLRTKLA